MPLRKYYSEHHIKNSGEKTVAKDVSYAMNYLQEQWYLIHAYLRPGYKRDTAGEMDFIVVGEKGLLVLEVKGSRWKLEGNKFYQTQNNIWQERESPFIQARENKAALVDILCNRGITNVLVASAVIFPECDFPLDFPPDEFWHLGRNERQDISSFIIKVLDEQFELQNKINNLGLSLLDKSKMNDIVDLLCPRVLPNEIYSHLTLSREEAKRLASYNLKILEGLRENRRLIIQGPPGSGKSSYAINLTNRKCNEGPINVLYLCWNELLAAYNAYKFLEAGNNRVTVWAYFHYIKHLMVLAGKNPDDLTFEKVNSPGELENQLVETLNQLDELGLTPKYDLIVVDECQDLFYKGIDHIINRMSVNDNGITEGDYAIFYDNTQVFSAEFDRIRYDKSVARIKKSAASYQIDHRYRGVGGNGLYEFIADLESGDIDFNRSYGSDLFVRTYKDTDEMWTIINKTYDEIRTQANYEDRQTVLLFTSNLSSGINIKKKKILDDELESNELFLRINQESLTAICPGKIKFTTALSYKGLERDIVVLVINDFYNQKIDCIHQVLIGASRARIRLYLIIDKESVDMNQQIQDKFN